MSNFLRKLFLLCYLLDTVFAGLPQLEIDALQNLYDATDGDNWKRKWDTESLDLSNAMCDSYLIECSGMSGNLNVIGIDLNHNNLAGTLPSEIGDFSKLTSLILSNNAIHGPIPSEIGNLHKIVHIDMTHNKLNGSVPDVFENLKAIEVVNFANNYLTGNIPPSMMENCGKLSKLHIANNLFEGQLP
eukprot:895961_1